MELFPGYCIDTCALIDLWRRHYPRDIFSSLWEEIEKLISQGFLIAPEEVYKEIKIGDDELFEWAKIHKEMFVKLDKNKFIYNYVEKIMNECEEFKKNMRYESQSVEADLFLISLSAQKGWTVVTSEKISSSPEKIPNICKRYNVKCIDLIEFFREKKWVF